MGITRIYHLIITEKHSIHLLLQLISLLPTLIALKIHSLPSDERTSFSFQEFSTFGSFRLRSKIAKVYIEEINNMKDVNYISLFCPYLKFFQVKQFNMNIELFLGTFLQRIYNNDLCHIRSLYFNVPRTDDEIIKNLDMMIRSEKLLFNYTIKRVYNKIHLQWE